MPPKTKEKVPVVAVPYIPMTDENFFKDLFGIPVPPTPDGKLELFKELVSLFDSLHDFGALGSVYDYVTTTKDSQPIYITNRKTIFNHLRNSYPRLKEHPRVSFLNSQLHCYTDNFHLKCSLSKAKLEDAFYNYAKYNIHNKSDYIATEYSSDDLGAPMLRYENMVTLYGPTVVFSIDTQKKLSMLTNALNLTYNMYQTYDMEKVCDPAPHSTESKDGMNLLIETAGATRRYAVPGITSAVLNTFNAEGKTANIKIDTGTAITVTMNAGSSHKNNITIVNNLLKAKITGFKDSNPPTNQNVPATTGFYDSSGIILYKTPTGVLETYVTDIRRTLAQKRLGDQLQVLSCQVPIQYTNTTGTLTNPIFVSIDRMAIAFAIANGVNCIYSNRNKLTLFKGASQTGVTIKSVPALGTALKAKKAKKPKKTKKGGVREDWDRFDEQLMSSPHHIMSIFMYTNLKKREYASSIRQEFYTFVQGINILSTTTNDNGDDVNQSHTNYYIRSYTETADDTIILHAPDESIRDKDAIVYLNKWYIYKDGSFITLSNIEERSKYKTLDIDAIKGILSAEGDNLSEVTQGGNREINNKEFLRILAQYDMFSLIDDEQMKLWYDIFYTTDNGIPFYSPTFYELNAFFQTLFHEEMLVSHEVHYMSIYTFLEEASLKNTYARDLVVIMDRILEYMGLSSEAFSESTKEDNKFLTKVLEIAEGKSNIYGETLNKLEGVSLADYIFNEDIVPMYFYRSYEAKYRPVSSKVLEPWQGQVVEKEKPLAYGMGGTRIRLNKRRGSPKRRTRRNYRKSK